MELLNKIQSYLTSLDQKRFYQYVGGALGIVAVIMLLLMFQYYRKISSLKSTIVTTNQEREEVKKILDDARKIKKGQKEIDAILAQDPNFKIAGYFEDLTSRLGLAQKRSSLAEVSTVVSEGKYQESVLQAKFTSITMKDLAQLLQEIELNKRVFTKELDITKAQKQANSIDVSLTIATLEPKPKELGESSE